MRPLKDNMKSAVIIFFLVVLFTSVSSAELIEPTRVLDGQGGPHGRLSVFSEPPEIEVLYDGTKTWTTPVINAMVEPGTHTLRVENSEIEFYLAPGKSMRFSYFKGKFVTIPEDSDPEKRAIGRSSELSQTAKLKKKSESRKQDYHPNYWPLNPKGQIY